MLLSNCPRVLSWCYSHTALSNCPGVLFSGATIILPWCYPRATLILAWCVILVLLSYCPGALVCYPGASDILVLLSYSPGALVCAILVLLRAICVLLSYCTGATLVHYPGATFILSWWNCSGLPWCYWCLVLLIVFGTYMLS